MSYLIGLYAQLACIWEATARKPGNVHRYRDFEDTSYLDFLTSAAAAAPVLAVAANYSVGHTLFEAVRLGRRVAKSNTNLGILLLLAPLARAAAEPDLRSALVRTLDGIDLEDTRSIYSAIRLASPGGLGRVAEQDIRDQPTLPLRQIMALAADRDLIALQYVNGFLEVFEVGLPALERGLTEAASLENAIIFCHLSLMAARPDSLIARKRGLVEAVEASRRARRVLEVGWPHEPAGAAALADLDAWLRAEGHTRNPGTTADLVAASLFVALRKGIITLPPQVPWSCG